MPKEDQHENYHCQKMSCLEKLVTKVPIVEVSLFAKNYIRETIHLIVLKDAKVSHA